MLQSKIFFLDLLPDEFDSIIKHPIFNYLYVILIFQNDNNNDLSLFKKFFKYFECY